MIEHIKTRPSSLDQKLGSDSDAATVADLIVDETKQVESDVVQGLLQQDIQKCMRKYLSDKEARVLELRFGLADGHARTIRQVSEEMAMSYGMTKSLLFRALSEMRKPHVARSLKDYISADDDDA